MSALFLLALASTLASASVQGHYDVVVLGSGLKESLMAGLLASQGKSVLQLERSSVLGGSDASLDLQQLSELTEGAGAKALHSSLGAPNDYSIERAPKVLTLPRAPADAA